VKQNRAARAHAYHRSRIEASSDLQHRVSAVADYLRSVLASMPAEQAAALVQRFSDETLELIEAAEHELGRSPAS
jgi:hypothetical protein